MRINILFVLQLLSEIANNEAIVFKFTNFVCENFNKSRILINECRLRAVSRNKTDLNFNATILHPANDVIVEGQFFKKANGYKPWLYKDRIDCCKFMSKAYNPLAILVFRTFQNYTNINHRCPYMGIVYAKGVNLDFSMLPHAIPTGDYLLYITWLYEKRKTVITKIYFMFVEDL